MNIPSDMEEKYVAAAVAHGMETEKGNHKEINKQYNKLTRIYRRMEKDKALGKEMTAKLLNHSSDFVRAWAAAHALGLEVNVDKAVEVLEHIAKTKGLVRLDAEMTLQVWREQGYLKF